MTPRLTSLARGRAGREPLRRGDSAIWLAGSGLGLCLLMIGGMIALILTKGLGFFWPSPIVEVTLKDGTVLMGEISGREPIPKPGTPDHLKHHRLQLKLGNRDLSDADFKWVDEDAIASRREPADALYVERREYGPFIGRITKITEATKGAEDTKGTENTKGTETTKGAEDTKDAQDTKRELTGDAARAALDGLVAKAHADRAAIRELERDRLGAVNYRMEQARLAIRRLDLRRAKATEATKATKATEATEDAEARAEIDRETAALKAEYDVLEKELIQRSEEAARVKVTFTAANGVEKELPALDLFRVYAANELSVFGRAGVYLGRLWEFLTGDPRESNTEGGIFPAIFGTVMMVMIMSVMSVPFGVLAALYLREYAKQGTFVRLVRIAVNNLAGVPSIVFGVFGLGFFVYMVGGTIDQVFYQERLPSPTFGTGGIMWASLTLALLTVPVVIVAAEEALAAVPRSMREASLAAGATTFQTMLRVVLPSAAPGILTGLILAMARGAGEVAPLMITGVVKLAPDLPLDSFFPFFHLERKFMHLGFHIYDVGFQSPNVEAAKPMVYATAVLLLLIVVLLNLTAIIVRNRLRRRYQSAAF